MRINIYKNEGGHLVEEILLETSLERYAETAWKADPKRHAGMIWLCLARLLKPGYMVELIIDELQFFWHTGVSEADLEELAALLVEHGIE